MQNKLFAFQSSFELGTGAKAIVCFPLLQQVAVTMVTLFSMSSETSLQSVLC
jgi:hypothetical protein